MIVTKMMSRKRRQAEEEESRNHKMANAMIMMKGMTTIRMTRMIVMPELKNSQELKEP